MSFLVPLCSTISGNSANTGGGLECLGCTLQLESSYLHANIAQGGAGMRLQMSSVVSAVSSVFSENVAAYRGGGVLVRPAILPSLSSCSNSLGSRDRWGVNILSCDVM